MFCTLVSAALTFRQDAAQGVTAYSRLLLRIKTDGGNYMSLIPEEPFGTQDPVTGGEGAEPMEHGASSQGAALQAEGALPSGSQDAARDKYLAIRNAVRQRTEESAVPDAKAEMADRIRRMKMAKEHPEEAPYQRTPRIAQEDAVPKKNVPKKKHKSKPNASKSRRKKRRGLNLFPHKGDSTFEVIRKTIFLMSSTIFMVCLVLIGKYFWENYQNNEKNEIIRLVYQEAEEKQLESGEDFRYYSLLPAAKALLETNPDVVGWIRIPTQDPEKPSPINYPVLQHRDEADGNVYYLDKDLYGNYEKAGSIFMDYRDYFDYVENGSRVYLNSQNLIIYGHNMHDYSMFGSLKYYINDAGYYDTHPIIELNSNYRKYKYKIFGMIIVDVDDTTETAFDYWNVLNFDGEEDFYDYVNEVKRRSVRLTDVDVTYGDQLLTLSTCNSTFSQGRLVLFARLVRDGEDLMEGCTSTENPNIKWPNSYYKWHKNTYDPDAEFVPYG